MKNKSTRIAAIVTAGLLAMGGLMPMTVALAEPAPTGSITITKGTDAEGTKTYDAYQLFSATVADDATSATGKTESDVEWAVNDATKKALSDYLAGKDATFAASAKNAQDAADAISRLIATDSASDLAAGTYTDATVNKDSVAKDIQDIVIANGMTPTTLTAGEAKALATGYWLIAPGSVDPQLAGKDANSDKNTGDSGTAPILAVVGGSAVTVKEKTSPVTVDKQVSEDGTNYHHAIDAQRGQQLHFQLTGTMPKDISSFETYKYVFHDSLSKGLSIDESSVKVTVDGTAVTPTTPVVADGTDGAHTLTVSFDDLKAACAKAGVSLTKDSVVHVDYTAALDADAVIGNAGNPNDVALEYTEKPSSDGTGTTHTVRNKVYSYGLTLDKLDANTKRALVEGFTIRLKAGDAENADKVGSYVQADGTLGEKAHVFHTTNGSFSVSGLDAGTYTISEQDPDTASGDVAGYTKVADFDVTITGDVDGSTGGTEELRSLTAKLATTDANHVILGTNTDKASDDHKIANPDGTDVTDAATGMVKVSVANTKQLNVPLTGQAGVTAALVAGGAVLLVTVVRRRKGTADED